jgi:hypothetical protein
MDADRWARNDGLGEATMTTVAFDKIKVGLDDASRYLNARGLK